jgi:hypothetical protein
MNKEQAVVWLLKGAMQEMPDEDKAMVETAAMELRALVLSHGEPGMFALALVGAEYAAKED